MPRPEDSWPSAPSPKGDKESRPASTVSLEFSEWMTSFLKKPERHRHPGSQTCLRYPVAANGPSGGVLTSDRTGALCAVAGLILAFETAAC